MRYILLYVIYVDTFVYIKSFFHVLQASRVIHEDIPEAQEEVPEEVHAEVHEEVPGVFPQAVQQEIREEIQDPSQLQSQEVTQEAGPSVPVRKRKKATVKRRFYVPGI